MKFKMNGISYALLFHVLFIDTDLIKRVIVNSRSVEVLIVGLLGYHEEKNCHKRILYN